MRKRDDPSLRFLEGRLADWVRKQCSRPVRPWHGLFQIQKDAIKTICAEDWTQDVILSAPTAGGKTVAAFLPLLSRARLDINRSDAADRRGFRILYLSPLLALLNQMGRADHDVQQLHAAVNLGAVVWHGEIGSSAKDAALDDLKGGAQTIATFMTTPESLESRLTLDPSFVEEHFANLQAVVIDELHSYFDVARGRQLMALIARLSRRLKDRQFRRVALSATLSERGIEPEKKQRSTDIDRARVRIGGFLRPDLVSGDIKRDADTIAAQILEINEKGNDDKFEIYLDSVIGKPEAASEDIARQIANTYRALASAKRQERNSVLIFANSKHDVEHYAGMLSGTRAPTPLPHTSTTLPKSWFRSHSDIYRKACAYLANSEEKGFTVADNPVEADYAALEERLQTRWKELAQEHIEEGASAPLTEDEVGEGRLRPAQITTRRYLTAVRRIRSRNLYWPHHASLKPPDRVQAESRMRASDVPCVVVCTTTLELGIDIGLVDDVCQIEPAPTVTALRQRLGRSRRAAYADEDAPPPRLNVFVTETEVPQPSQGGLPEIDNPLLYLHFRTFQAVAQILLLRDRVYEPLRDDRLDLSTLVQQILNAVTAEVILAEEAGGDPLSVSVSASEIQELLCAKGPFRLASKLLDGSDKSIFDAVLESLSDPTTASPRLTRNGDRIGLTETGLDWVNRPDIYAAFASPREMSVKHGSETIGTLSVRSPIGIGDMVTLRGQTWLVVARDARGTALFVRRASTGRASHFPGQSIPISGAIIERMKRLYQEPNANALVSKAKRKMTLSDNAETCLRDGWHAARTAPLIQGIHETRLGTYYMPWRGRRHIEGMLGVLSGCSVPAVDLGFLVFVPTFSHTKVKTLIGGRAARFLQLTPHEQLRGRGGGAAGKFHAYVSPMLRRVDMASSEVSYESARDLFGLKD